MIHFPPTRITPSLTPGRPTRRARFPRVAAALCATSLLAAACGGAETEASSSSTTETDPLLAGALNGRTLDEVMLEMEAKVQECMTALGWEYTVVAPGSEGADLIGSTTGSTESARGTGSCHRGTAGSPARR